MTRPMSSVLVPHFSLTIASLLKAAGNVPTRPCVCCLHWASIWRPLFESWYACFAQFIVVDCLILSLTLFPVGQDEFDVFMDPQARKLTIDMLIHLAKKKMAHRQFIFITPQDLSHITADPQLKVMKLKAPERHSAVGGPSQQTLDFTQN